MKYKIALQKTEERYSGSVPGLPGCWSQVATEEEAIANIQDAIRIISSRARNYSETL
jgi:predicted RNase H-like HicB family nuclease